MIAVQRAAADEALANYVSGQTLELGGASGGSLPGTTLIDREAGAAYDDLGAHEEGSIDAIVSAGGVEHCGNVVAAIREWQRVLRDGGQLAVVLRDPADQEAWVESPNAYTPDAWAALLGTVGGFEIVNFDALEGVGMLVVAKRCEVLDLRQVLGMQGAALAEAAKRGPEHLAELCFQFGTVLLRSGTSRPAIRCFEEALEREPDNADCLFGIGMCHAIDKRWGDAISWLERAVTSDPNNSETKRWLGLARLEFEAGSVDIGPQSAQP